MTMSFVNYLKVRLQNMLVRANVPLERMAERQLILQAQLYAQNNRQKNHLSRLQDVEFCAFSQWGEDGIIDWLVENLPGIAQTFVEFGVGDYRESNTRLLLQLRNWRGLVLDGSAEHIADIRSQDLYWRHDIQANRAFIDRENINNLISDAGFSGDIGLLSVDIDGNDYWVWQAIQVVCPAIVVCEYNAVFGDKYQLTVPYRADFQRAKEHHSLLCFGASLKAMISLGQAKGYTFVGTGSSGCNAFFVRTNIAAPVLAKLASIWAFPSSAREARDHDGRLLFVGGVERAKLIAEQAIVNLEVDPQGQGAFATIADLGDLYSDAWRMSLGAQV